MAADGIYRALYTTAAGYGPLRKTSSSPHVSPGGAVSPSLLEGRSLMRRELWPRTFQRTHLLEVAVAPTQEGLGSKGHADSGW